MTELTPTKINESALSKLILKGDLSTLSDTEKVQYYHQMCERLGIDPLTKPFDYMVMQGKQVLYLNKGGAEQLNKVHNVSMMLVDSKKVEDIYIVTAKAKIASNGVFREVDSTGCVSVKGLYGEALANAFMKSETKAKRRATISLLGLAMLDETEVETIPGAKTQEAKVEVLGEKLMPAHISPLPIQPPIEAPIEPSMEDWEKVHKLVKDNKYPIAYFNVWKDRESKDYSPLEVYENALVKFGKPNKGGVEKDEVKA